MSAFDPTTSWSLVGLAVIFVVTAVCVAEWAHRRMTEDDLPPEHILIHDPPQSFRLVERAPTVYDWSDEPL